MNHDDLFDNAMVRSILKQMTPEEIDKYKKIGKELYGNMEMINGIKAEVTNGLNPSVAGANPLSSNKEIVPDEIKDSLAYISEGLKSGLLPKDLDDDEKNILKEYYGTEWYKNFGYKKEDL